MGCTRADLLRWLPVATRHAPAVVDGDRVTIAVGGGSVQIEFRERPLRRIGAFALPVLDVCFRFTDLDAAARDDFVAHFDLCTRRGGG